MVNEINIENETLIFDTEMTKKFYLSQEKTKDGCQCLECKYYVDFFTKQPFEIFLLLQKMGVDLEKNLESEPTGVWCVRDDNGKLLHCDQAYQIFGNINSEEKSEIKYSKIENNYKIDAYFKQINVDNLHVSLDINLLNNKT
ncbi:MAG: hypothetical protein RLZZ175_1943 [Bacteroidota bacterium]|jgi:hypothetical protein